MAEAKVASGLGQLFSGALERSFLERLAAQLKDGTQADDLAQEVYLRLLRSNRGLFIQDPRRYAIRVASNVAIEWARLARHQRPHLQETTLDSYEAPQVSPEEQADLDQQLASVDKALAAMTPARRAAVLMRLRDGSTHAEIAARLGVSESMVYKHLTLGLDACRKALGEGSKEAVAQGRRGARKEQECS